MVVARVRISLVAGEFEVEGPEAFIRKYDPVVDELLENLRNAPTPKTASVSNAKEDGSHKRDDGLSTSTSEVAEPSDFGEILQELPPKATNTDQILLAGHYVQQGSTDNTFSTGEANSLLLEQGVKLSNASQSLKNNLEVKRAFKVSNKRWKVSKVGEDHLNSLRNT
jgi:hypothetical protein